MATGLDWIGLDENEREKQDPLWLQYIVVPNKVVPQPETLNGEKVRRGRRNQPCYTYHLHLVPIPYSTQSTMRVWPCKFAVRYIKEGTKVNTRRSK